MKHLDEEQFAAVIAGEADEEAQKHALHCYECSVEVERMRQFLGEFRQAISAVAERPRRFQPVQLPVTRWRMALAAAAMACLILVAGVLLQSAKRRDVGPAAPIQQQAQKEDADDQLLLEIDQDISRSSPRALEPASLIVAARNKHARQQ